MPLLGAIGWRMGMRRRRSFKSGSLTRNKLIVLAKSAGVEDVERAFEEGEPAYAVFYLPRTLVKDSFRHFLSNRVTDSCYFSDDEAVEVLKKAYRDYLSKVLICFDKYFGIGAVAQFNMVYRAEREFASACTALGIPFFTLYKENLRSQATWHESVPVFRTVVGRYAGWKIAVYNESAKACLIESEVVKPSQVEVVGCARMDYSHLLRANRVSAGPRHVLYYMISPQAGLGFLMKKGGRFYGQEKYGANGVSWFDLIAETNAAFLHIARTHPEISFVVKVKTGASQMQVEALGADVPENVQIVEGGVGHNLLIDASVVIAFNSTTVLEAVAAGVPVIVPHIFSDREEPLKPYVLEVCEAVFCPETRVELEAMIIEFAKKDSRYTELSSGQKEVLDRLLGNPDGQAGRRLKKFIDDIMVDGRSIKQ